MGVGFAPEIEAVDVEEFEFERICTPYKERCDRAAKFLWVAKCCGWEFPLCELCHQQQLVWMSYFRDTAGDCANCGARWESCADGYEWGPL